ncbi:MAG TPA: glycosyltransferase [Gemmatales bacterium]|nr:glycosyltransferase [Gemmatales bacterium]HMP60382.1 glycosyltransferase [Gemmatales bacterium]
MKILQVSTADRASGAEFVALNLHQGLRRRGCTTWMAVAERHTDSEGVFVLDNDAERGGWTRFWLAAGRRLGTIFGSGAVGRRIRSLLGYRLGQPGRAWKIDQGWEDFDFPATRRLPDLTPSLPDLLHCNNLHGGYFDLRALPELAERLPVVLTLHDMWPLTGHCASALGCPRWQTGCGACPDLGIYPPVKKDNTAANWRRKRDLFSASGVEVICTSQWMKSQLPGSTLDAAAATARVIHLGIETDVFTTLPDQQATRAELGIPADAAVLVWTCSSGRKNVFKDYQTLETATREVAARGVGRPLWFLLVGGEPCREPLGTAQMLGVGHVSDRRRLAQLYRAGDVFIHATKAEAWGLTITEALASGLPVVSTAVGGIPEQVLHEETGLLVAPGDAAAFANATYRLLLDETLRRRLGNQGAELARSRFGIERQVDEYLSAFQSIRADWEKRRSRPRQPAPVAMGV